MQIYINFIYVTKTLSKKKILNRIVRECHVMKYRCESAIRNLGCFLLMKLCFFLLFPNANCKNTHPNNIEFMVPSFSLIFTWAIVCGFGDICWRKYRLQKWNTFAEPPFHFIYSSSVSPGWPFAEKVKMLMRLHLNIYEPLTLASIRLVFDSHQSKSWLIFTKVKSHKA